MNDANGELKGFLHKVAKQRYARCLYGDYTCAGEAIRAHSIQNANVLDALCVDGHVFTFDVRAQNAVPQLVLARVGRNEASTFTGLCSLHDGELFRPIDTTVPDLGDEHHRFLVAYRSVLRELHSTMAGGRRLQTKLTGFVERDLVSAGYISPPMEDATAAISQSYLVAQYRAQLDRLAASRRHGVLRTIGMVVPGRVGIAASSFFSAIPDDGHFPRDPPFLTMNVFPVENETRIWISMLPGHEAAVRRYLRFLLSAGLKRRSLVLSRYLLTHCENVVLSPSLVDRWTGSRRRDVLDEFAKSVPALARTGSPNMMLSRTEIDLFD